MDGRKSLASLLSLIFGSVAVLINLRSASAEWLPNGLKVLVPLATLGIAPLPGVYLARPNSLRKALRNAVAQQCAVVLGAAVTTSLTTGPSFINAIAFVALFGTCEFALITIPAISGLQKVFIHR
jgi:hypothetical protein